MRPKLQHILHRNVITQLDCFTLPEPKELNDSISNHAFITSPQNRGGVILSLQFVRVCVCEGALLVNKIPAKRMNRFGRGFR